MARIRPGFRLRRGQNLADLTDKAAARQSLELGSAALKPAGGWTGLNADTLDGQHLGYFVNIPARLGFTPLQQGGGQYMQTNKVIVGWDGPAGRLRAQVDATLLGFLVTNENLNSVLAERATQGELGTYAFLQNRSGTTLGPGQLVNGAQLVWSSSSGNDGGGPIYGTWRTLGNVLNTNSTLFVRVGIS
ncbi:hypothetical protein [Vreelandella sulfidaeris]|uniref:hypothetical protein n=1 Tax=Vreelandella sulfidaeris TaxID=115553 RepID=UPI0035EC0490